MKYNSITAARKAFKEAVNAQVTEICDLGTICVQIYSLQYGSEYEVITEFGKDLRGHYYIKNREGERFGIKNLNAVDFENLVERFEEVMTEAADAAEEFAQHGAVNVEATGHNCGYTCTWSQFVDACEDLREANDNNGIYEELGCVATCANIDINPDAIRVYTESSKEGTETTTEDENDTTEDNTPQGGKEAPQSDENEPKGETLAKVAKVAKEAAAALPVLAFVVLLVGCLLSCPPLAYIIVKTYAALPHLGGIDWVVCLGSLAVVTTGAPSCFIVLREIFRNVRA